MAELDPIKTKLTEMFNIRYPIIGAPMFLVSDEKMTTEISRCGGLGTFPALNYRPIEKFEESVRSIRSKNTGPFGINIIVQKSNKWKDKQIEIALENEVDLVITSLGNPRELIQRAKGTKTKIFCDVIGSEHAKKVEDLGADGLIAVAHGAGGHAGNISPFALIPQLRRETHLPIVAAGSISDGKGLAAALALGASGVYMGTRFIASKESPVTPEYKTSIVNSKSEDIVNTDRVDGFPGNFILTPKLEKLGVHAGPLESLVKMSKKGARVLAMSRAARALFLPENAKASYKSIFSAGQGVGNIEKIESIESIINNTVSEYQKIKSTLP